jgi:hypothetical protein
MHLKKSQKTKSTPKKTSESQKKAQEKYDKCDIERRRKQKKEYMRRKRLENPNYCKWK